jgi:hypothetical protein
VRARPSARHTAAEVTRYAPGNRLRHVARGLEIRAGTRLCAVRREDVRWLIQELRRLSSQPPTDSASTMATLLEHALETDHRREIDLTDAETTDLLAVIDHGRLERAPLADGLECLRDGILIDRGVI